MPGQAESIVVGFDGSPGSQDALRLGAVLARATGTELEVAVALPYEPLPLPVEAYDEALEEHFEELFEGASRILESEPFVRRRLRERSAARALTELAEAEPVRAIVVGSEEQGPQGFARPGRVGERLLTGAPCAVAVAPRGYGRRRRLQLRTIGVAYDGTDEAKRALDAGRALARDAGASLRVITVVPHVPVLPSRIGHTERGYAKVLRRHFEQVLDDARAAVGSGVDAGFLLEEGSPAKVIAAVTRLLDLVVIGSRGYGPVRRALLGGTAADVVATARCPTLVVPRGG